MVLSVLILVVVAEVTNGVPIIIINFIIVHVILGVIIDSLGIAAIDVNNINEVLGPKTVNSELEIKYEATGSLNVVVSWPTVDVAVDNYYYHSLTKCYYC